MARLPEFPNPVDEVAARLVAGGVVLAGLAVLAFDATWVIPVMAYGFVARALAGPRFSPLALLVTRVVVPRLGAVPKPTPGPPKRFAQAVGAAFTVTATVLAYGVGAETWAHGLVAVLVVFATLESVFAICVGCRAFAVLMGLGVIPEDVCADCNDIWARRERLAP